MIGFDREQMAAAMRGAERFVLIVEAGVLTGDAVEDEAVALREVVAEALERWTRRHGDILTSED